MSVSVARMSPSSNQRRAMPVVTMMTFHVGVSGVASRSRLTTPTLQLRRCRGSPRRSGGSRASCPVPVPATMPKPLPAARELAHARAVVLLEKGLDVETERELDRLARGARRRDDDDAAGRWLGRDEGFVIGEVRIADVAYHAQTARTRPVIWTDRLFRWPLRQNRPDGFTPVKPLTLGGSLALSPAFVLVESA